MTATKTGGERNASVFGGYFVEAFADGQEEPIRTRIDGSRCSRRLRMPG